MNATPIDVTEDEYEEYLNDAYGDVDVCGTAYPAGQVLREVDPIRFEMGASEMEPVQWSCGECGGEFNDEDEADECCKPECSECGTKHDTEEEAIECCQEEKEQQKQDDTETQEWEERWHKRSSIDAPNLDYTALKKFAKAE